MAMVDILWQAVRCILRKLPEVVDVIVRLALFHSKGLECVVPDGALEENHPLKEGIDEEINHHWEVSTTQVSA